MAETSKPVGIMPNHVDLREISFTNLLLLDFNPEEMESKYRVVFNRSVGICIFIFAIRINQPIK